MQDPTIASEPLPSVVPGGTIYAHHFGFVKNGLKGATCAICSDDPKRLGEYFDSTQGFRGHTSSGVHKSKAERAVISSGTFVIDGMAWCVACEKQLAASEAAQHQSTRAHETALALWEVTDDEKMSGKKRKQVEKIELGLQEHSLLWDRIGDFMQATVTLSHARDAAVKGCRPFSRLPPTAK
ncbi:uncharacterized protein ACA1_057990 [Acanthamoeba castellanii str. Neff]|uniref:Uncharacterized protein n=1 Tax=Acanthamoeba castellanii (strain ATCC 30010 / Neff) TaxID=1257118 RepID=L8GX64_ACACF|nr:uncharacterized protein ACA1_057990 [Acanthamoeba castellanii str. Neff]ELR17143.1 hypothetical protein ACA1_057990 [Acanthamoeba castellanii str. Neff]